VQGFNLLRKKQLRNGSFLLLPTRIKLLVVSRRDKGWLAVKVTGCTVTGVLSGGLCLAETPKFMTFQLRIPEKVAG